MYVFIGGIPTSGKSHLTEDFIKESKLDILHVRTDSLRDEFKNDDSLSKWVNYFRNIDEVEYWKRTSCTEHINNVKVQSRALWPHILEKIINLKSKNEHIIFEGVSIMPRYARKYLSFNGFFLIPENVETIYIRLKAHARWGKTDTLKRKEAECFYRNGIGYITTEAKEYGYKVFNNIEDGRAQLAGWFGI